MNLKSLLILGASMFIGASAYAEWTKPVVKTQDFVTDGVTPQYIYNVEAQKFMVGANDWSTRSSVGDKGYQFKIAQTGEEIYSLTDHVEKGNDGKDKGWLKMFVDGPTGIWVDNNNGANADTWTLVDLGGGKYNIGNTAFDGEMLGTDISGADTRNYLSSYFDENGIEAGYTWAGVSVEAYDEYFPEVERYNAAMTLKAAIEDMEEAYPSVDISSEKAVYLDEESTKEQLDAAIAAVAEKKTQAILDEAKKNASLDNPVDMTNFIVNATFDKEKDFTGWSGTGFGAGGTTSTCAEQYQAIFDTYQDIKNMPNGVYKVNVDGFYRSGSTEEEFANAQAGKENNAFVYGANVVEEKASAAETVTGPIMHLFYPSLEPYEHYDLDGNDIGGLAYADPESGDTYYVPNSMLDFTNYNGTTKKLETPFYKTNTSGFFASTDGTLRIGVKKSVKNDMDWVIVDNFGLTYYGNGAEAWAAVIGDIKATVSLDEDALISTSIKEEFDKVVAAASATDAESYKAAVAAIDEVKKAADENTALWAKYKKLGETAQQLLDDPDYEGVAEADDLAGYMEYDYKDLLGDPTSEFYLSLNTDELKEEIETLDGLIKATTSATKPGTDMTKLITNPDFAKGGEGWTYSGTGHGGAGVAFNAGAKCAEAWNSGNFDIHQDITNAPVGVYEIQVQGFYRYGRGDAAWSAYFIDEPNEYIKTTPAMLYLNSNTHNLANVFDYQVPVGEFYTTQQYKDPNEEFWYPDGMISAGQAFDEGAYKVSAYGLVAKEGDPLRIGVKGNTTQLGDSWAIFTRFKLIYQGLDADIIKGELENEMTALDAKVDGKSIPSALKTEIAAVKAAANAAIEAENGKAMFEALQSLYEVKGKVDDAIAKFAELETVCEDIEAVLNETNAPTNIVAKAQNFVADVEANMGDYDDETIAAKIVEGKEIITLLSYDGDVIDVLKEEMQYASDETPIDATVLLINPSFEDATGVSQTISAWTQAGAINFQTQNNTAFGKDGSYYAERWHVDGTLDLYQTVPMSALELPAGFYGISALTHCSTGDGVIYANDKETAISNTDDAAVPATDLVVVEIKEGENLTFGVKATLTADSWCCVDNFQLFYYGTTDPTAVQDVTAKVVKEDVAKAIKLYNNKLRKVIIEKNGKKYNVAGIEVK